MEHRYSKRVDAQLNVLLYSDGVPVAVGKTRNISAKGVFIGRFVFKPHFFSFRDGKRGQPGTGDQSQAAQEIDDQWTEFIGHR